MVEIGDPFTDTLMTIQRKNVMVYQDIAVMLDLMSQQEAAYYAGASPYTRFNLLSMVTGTQILQGDLLIDQNMANIDPRTMTNVQYRAIIDSTSWPDGHIECVVDKIRGD